MTIETTIAAALGVIAGALLKDWLDRRRDRDRPRLAATEDHHRRRVADTYDALMDLHEQLSCFAASTELAGLGAHAGHCETARAARAAIDRRLRRSTPLIGEETSSKLGHAVRQATVALRYAERAADAKDGHLMYAAMSNAAERYKNARPAIEAAFANLRSRLHGLGAEPAPRGRATPPALYWVTEPDVMQDADHDDREGLETSGTRDGSVANER